MRVLHVLLICATLGVVLCEYCVQQNTTSCAHIQCPSTMVPTCELSICTCNDKPAGACSQLSDCDKINYWSGHHCGHSHKYCEKGQCACIKHQG